MAVRRRRTHHEYGGSPWAKRRTITARAIHRRPNASTMRRPRSWAPSGGRKKIREGAQVRPEEAEELDQAEAEGRRHAKDDPDDTM